MAEGSTKLLHESCQKPMRCPRRTDWASGNATRLTAARKARRLSGLLLRLHIHCRLMESVVSPTASMISAIAKRHSKWINRSKIRRCEIDYIATRSGYPTSVYLESILAASHQKVYERHRASPLGAADSFVLHSSRIRAERAFIGLTTANNSTSWFLLSARSVGVGD